MLSISSSLLVWTLGAVFGIGALFKLAKSKSAEKTRSRKVQYLFFWLKYFKPIEKVGTICNHAKLVIIRQVRFSEMSLAHGRSLQNFLAIFYGQATALLDGDWY